MRNETYQQNIKIKKYPNDENVTSLLYQQYQEMYSLSLRFLQARIQAQKMFPYPQQKNDREMLKVEKEALYK